MAAALTSIRQNADTGTGTDTITITATATSISLIERRSNDEKLTYVLYFFNNLAILYKQYRTFIQFSGMKQENKMIISSFNMTISRSVNASEQECKQFNSSMDSLKKMQTSDSNHERKKNKGFIIEIHMHKQANMLSTATIYCNNLLCT